MSDPNEITGVTHYLGRFAEGGAICVADVGPFTEQQAAQLCADMATAEGVEDIEPELIRRARLAYLERSA